MELNYRARSLKRFHVATQKQNITNGKIFFSKKNLKMFSKKIEVKKNGAISFFGGLWFEGPFLNSCLNCCYPGIYNHLNAAPSTGTISRNATHTNNRVKSQYLEHGNHISAEDASRWVSICTRIGWKKVDWAFAFAVNALKLSCIMYQCEVERQRKRYKERVLEKLPNERDLNGP